MHWEIKCTAEGQQWRVRLRSKVKTINRVPAQQEPCFWRVFISPFEYECYFNFWPWYHYIVAMMRNQPQNCIYDVFYVLLCEKRTVIFLRATKIRNESTFKKTENSVFWHSLVTYNYTWYNDTRHKMTGESWQWYSKTPDYSDIS